MTFVLLAGPLVIVLVGLFLPVLLPVLIPVFVIFAILAEEVPGSGSPQSDRSNTRPPPALIEGGRRSPILRKFSSPELSRLLVKCLQGQRIGSSLSKLQDA